MKTRPRSINHVTLHRLRYTPLYMPLYLQSYLPPPSYITLNAFEAFSCGMLCSYPILSHLHTWVMSSVSSRL